MSDSINETFAKAMVEEFTKVLVSGIKPIFKNLRDEIKNLLDDGMQNYLNKQTDKYAYIKTFLHRSSPKYFYDIYFPLNIESRSGKGEIINTESVKAIFEKSNYITIIGEAGSGKSMLIKHLF